MKEKEKDKECDWGLGRGKESRESGILQHCSVFVTTFKKNNQPHWNFGPYINERDYEGDNISLIVA